MLGLRATSTQIVYYEQSFDTAFYPFLERIYDLVTNQGIKNQIAIINDDYIRNPNKLTN